MDERAPAVVAQVAPERVLAGRVGAEEPVEADAELAVAAPRGLGVRRLDARDERVARARVGAVGGVRRDGEVDLVGHLQPDHTAVGAEGVDDLAHEREPGAGVADLLGPRVVAELELHAKARARVAPGQCREAVDACLPVGPEEPVEPQDERRAARAQALQGGQRPGRVVGHRRHGRAQGARLARRGDAEGHRRGSGRGRCGRRQQRGRDEEQRPHSSESRAPKRRMSGVAARRSAGVRPS